MSEKPLHVRVAEALGWQSRGPSGMGDRGCGGTEFWVPPGLSIDGARSHCNVCSPDNAPPRFDTDWSATGPLIEKYGISLTKTIYLGWLSESVEAVSDIRGGPTALVAICNLILALKEAGKLPA